MTINNAIDDVIFPHFAEGRLTLTSGDPIGADVTDADTLYYAPYIGDIISLYDMVSGLWVPKKFVQTAIAIPSTTNTNYDLFGYDNSGTFTLELQAWTDDSTRNVTLGRQNSVIIQSGAANKRYLGTIRTTGTTGRCSDNPANRFVWNYYNRVFKRLYKAFDAASWTYNTINTWRQCNASAANQLEIVTGQNEDAIYLWYMLTHVRGLASFGFIGIGNDSTTVNSASSNRGDSSSTTLRNNRLAQFVVNPGVGYHFYPALEAWGTTGSGNATFERDSNTYSIGSMNGLWRC